MKRFFSNLLFIAAASILFVPIIASAQETGSGGIGGRPAFPRDDNPRSDSIFIHTLEPGQSVEDGIKVINNAEEARTVNIYATDSIPSSGGAFACKQEVESKDAVGSWITLAKNQVTLESAQSEVVPFEINVPNGVDVGEHNGCIVIQEEKPAADVEEGIGLSFRTAIRTAILIPGEITKNLEVINFTHQVKSNKVILTPTVKNTGNVSVDANVETTLAYPLGIELSEAGGQFPVLIDQETIWNFEHERPFWGGFVKSAMDLSYDNNPDTYIGEESGETAFLNYEGSWFFVMPQFGALIVYAAVLAIIILLIYSFFKKAQLKKDIKKNWKSHKVKSGEDIKSIAKEHNMSWKKLATANKIKAPYTLEDGQSIKVPKVHHDEQKK